MRTSKSARWPLICGEDRIYYYVVQYQVISRVRFECQTKTLTYFECQTQGSSVRLTGSSVRLTLNLSLTFEPCQADIPFRFECETKKRGCKSKLSSARHTASDVRLKLEQI